MQTATKGLMGLAIVLAASAALMTAPTAFAQKPPAPSGITLNAGSFYGHWNGVVNWNDNSLDGPLSFEFLPNGQFIDNYGDEGVWEVTQDGIRIRYLDGGMTVYEGGLVEGTIIGTMATTPPNFQGAFVLWRTE